MANENLNSGYGQSQASGVPFTTGKTFFVADSADANFNDIDGLFVNDQQGVPRRYSTPTAALGACTAGHGDQVVLSPNYTTAITEAELESAATKGVSITSATPARADGAYVVTRATSTLPQTADLSLFTITGKVEIVQIVGEITTVIETQANATLLKINPTVGADVDLCAALDISADADGSLYTITGTFADALINTVSGAVPSQASGVVVTAGVLELECAASNTGSVKWTVVYKAIDPAAKILVA